jgi:hypothetical protein
MHCPSSLGAQLRPFLALRSVVPSQLLGHLLAHSCKQAASSRHSMQAQLGVLAATAPTGWQQMATVWQHVALLLEIISAW